MDKIHSNPKNPKLHSQSSIDKSVKEFGVRQPIIVVPLKNGEYEIVAGHGRILSFTSIGKTEIPCIIWDETNKDRINAYMVADNSTVICGGWEDIKLSELLQELEVNLPDIDFDLFGFEDTDLRELLGEEELEIIEDEPPEIPVEAISKTGDLWTLGRHRLLCGDACKDEDVKRLMGDDKAVLMATDPPYGDSWVQKAKDMHEHGYGHSRAVLHGSIESDDKSPKELKEFLDTFLSVSKLAGNPPFPIYVWHRAKRMIFEQSLMDAGYHVHQPVIWVKKSFVIGRLHYHPRCEWALHGWLKGGGKCPYYGKRNQSDVWEVDRENDSVHPTQKPLKLFLTPILNHTKKDEICYDPFVGSGTCMIAAEQSGRRCFAIELEPRYVDVCLQRFYNLTQISPVRDDGVKWTSLIKKEHP